jgi:uracil-DNA glycosylase family 4
MSMQAAAVLKAYLEQRRAAGTSHVPLRPGSLERLRAYRQGRRARAEEVRRLVEEEPPAPFVAEAPQPIVCEPAKPDPVLNVPGTTKAEKLAALAALAETAPAPRALGSLRETMVFATGTPDAELMFIGEAPGAEEERQREPFVGPAGQKLTGIIKAMGLDRSQVYISNICKFRPAMPNQGSSNRAPTREEMQACLPFILTEIDIIRPKVIVALGKTACEGLGIAGSVSSLRGTFFEVRGIPTMVTFHPSFILREERLSGGGIEVKRQVWEDMLKVMDKCGLPISAKQRGYFQRG